MTETSDTSRDLAGLVVPSAGSVVESDDPWQPYRLLDAEGEVVVPVAEYLQDLQAIGRPATTQRSYALALLRWFRFLWTVGVPWEQATRVEARDFSRWLQVVAKPKGGGSAGQGRVNPVTGKSGPGRQYAPRTRAHSETVLRSFYAFHLELGTGPLVNPFPLFRRRDGERLDITGARWGLDGAEAVLELRALNDDGDFDEYWTFHLAREHECLYPTPDRQRYQLTA
jgi:hypothetical protein